MLNVFDITHCSSIDTDQPIAWNQATVFRPPKWSDSRNYKSRILDIARQGFPTPWIICCRQIISRHSGDHLSRLLPRSRLLSLPFSNEQKTPSLLLANFFLRRFHFFVLSRWTYGTHAAATGLQPLSPVGYAYGGQNLSLDGRCFCSFRRISRFRKCH